MQIRDVIMAETSPLPPMPRGIIYQYVVAGNGTFIRAEDSRMTAMVPVEYATMHGLEDVEPYARLKMPRIPLAWLYSILKSARAKMPNEAMYQFTYHQSTLDYAPSTWQCKMPDQETSGAHVTFEDNPDSVVDLHSHNSMAPFFSTTDDADEKGLRFYAVIGRIDADQPQIVLRVGVYGHTMNVPLETVFDGPGPFVQVDPEVEQVLEEADLEIAKSID